MVRRVKSSPSNAYLQYKKTSSDSSHRSPNHPVVGRSDDEQTTSRMVSCPWCAAVRREKTTGEKRSQNGRKRSGKMIKTRERRGQIKIAVASNREVKKGIIYGEIARISLKVSRSP